MTIGAVAAVGVRRLLGPLKQHTKAEMQLAAVSHMEHGHEVLLHVSQCGSVSQKNQMQTGSFYIALIDLHCFMETSRCFTQVETGSKPPCVARITVRLAEVLMSDQAMCPLPRHFVQNQFGVTSGHGTPENCE